MKITRGFEEPHRDRAAELFWGAFQGKLGRLMGPEAKALAFLRETLDPTYCFAATEADRLLGLVGFKTYEGAFSGGTFADLRRAYGLWGAVWRGTLLEVLERDVENRRFLLDGIFVAPEARGRGVGTALLTRICEEGRLRGYREIRLDVIDSNPRARTLYEREEFAAVATSSIGPLRHIFGFREVTTMVKRL